MVNMTAFRIVDSDVRCFARFFLRKFVKPIVVSRAVRPREERPAGDGDQEPDWKGDTQPDAGKRGKNENIRTTYMGNKSRHNFPKTT